MTASIICGNISVLSKLKYAGAEINTAAARDRHQVLAGLLSWFGTDLTDIRPVAGGTFSLCLTGVLNGRPRFFKTHLVTQERNTLAREAAFLQATAGHVDPQLLHTPEGDADRIWLHTHVLQPCPPLAPPAVRHLVAKVEADVNACPQLAGQVAPNDHIDRLLSVAATSKTDMASHTSTFVQDKVCASIARVQSACRDAPRQLCHGDLGPANIMTDGQQAIALDWEDACWGMAGYDYLYWLTFFDNRKWLSRRDTLGHTPLGRKNEVALMVVIVWLKSWLSVRNGSHHRNALSLEQRLRELIALDE